MSLLLFIGSAVFFCGPSPNSFSLFLYNGWRQGLQNRLNVLLVPCWFSGDLFTTISYHWPILHLKVTRSDRIKTLQFSFILLTILIVHNKNCYWIISNSDHFGRNLCQFVTTTSASCCCCWHCLDSVFTLPWSYPEWDVLRSLILMCWLWLLLETAHLSSYLHALQQGGPRFINLHLWINFQTTFT
jgi:hypothetical protein